MNRESFKKLGYEEKTYERINPAFIRPEEMNIILEKLKKANEQLFKRFDEIDTELMNNHWLQRWNLTESERNFNCPHFYRKYTTDIWQSDPCSGCANPNCPKFTKTIC